MRSLSAALSGQAPNPGDGQNVVLRLSVRGELGKDYLAFVADRARWLSISGWIESPAAGEAEILVRGPEALVGALEMACMLGPLDALVDTLETRPVSQSVPAGFTIR